MQTINSKTILLVAAILGLAACKPNAKAPSPDKGNVDATKYVALGNSLTAGFADAALYYEGQMNSYANILAQQFKLIGGGEFVQPLTPVSSVGIGSTLNARLIMGYKTDCKGVEALSPVPSAAAGDVSLFLNSAAASGPFNNMGVPGAKAITAIFPGYGNPANGFGLYNPYFTRMLAPSEYSSASMLSKCASQNPTFFSVFIGNNDVLGYALAGGNSDAVTPAAGPPGVGFDASYDVIVTTMTGNGAKGVLGNIPDVTSIPYFTTIPYNGLVLDAATAGSLSAAYAALGISFKEGNNAFIIRDTTAPGKMRQIKSNELVLLSTPQDSIRCAFWGSKKPIPAQYILTAGEISNIQTAVTGYNNKIKAVASAKGLAYVDVNAFMNNFKKGIVYNGVTISTTFASGGAFSLDGIHLTPRGNALLANEFIKAINSTYSSTVPQVNVASYNGVVFP